jgi:indolepyruvate ferredoxin oxidoreductase beta subunit
VVINADELCKNLGSSKFFNVAVLGVAKGAGFLPFSEEDLLSTIETSVKANFVEVNKKAFLHGVEVGKNN